MASLQIIKMCPNGHQENTLQLILEGELAQFGYWNRNLIIPIKRGKSPIKMYLFPHYHHVCLSQILTSPSQRDLLPIL